MIPLCIGPSGESLDRVERDVIGPSIPAPGTIQQELDASLIIASPEIVINHIEQA